MNVLFSSRLVVSFPGPLKEENLLTVAKPLPKQLWETKEVGEQHSACLLSLNICTSGVIVKSCRGENKRNWKKGREDTLEKDGSNKNYHTLLMNELVQ